VGLLAFGLTLYLDLPIVEDALFYEDSGYAVASEWLSGKSVDFETFSPGGRSGWLLITAIASFYYVTDGVRALPVLLIASCFVTALTPVYVYRLAKQLQAPEAVARRAGWLVALSPAFVFWSGSLYKEGFTLLFLSIAASHTLRLQSGWHGRSIAMILLCILGLWGLRYYIAILLTVATALSLFLGRMRSTRRMTSLPVLLRQIAVVAAFMVLIIAFGVTERTEHVLVEEERTGLLMDLDARRVGSAREAASGYLHDERIDTPEGAMRYFPLGLVYFLTVPLPWQVGAIRQNLIIPENAFWLMLYPLIVVGMGRAFKSNRPGTVFLLLLTAGMCSIYALLAANVGTAYRMRSQVWLLWAPFAAWGWELWRERRRGKALRARRRLQPLRRAPVIR
jgi:hypothetical protein